VRASKSVDCKPFKKAQISEFRLCSHAICTCGIFKSDRGLLCKPVCLSTASPPQRPKCPNLISHMPFQCTRRHSQHLIRSLQFPNQQSTTTQSIHQQIKQSQCPQLTTSHAGLQSHSCMRKTKKASHFSPQLTIVKPPQITHMSSKNTCIPNRLSASMCDQTPGRSSNFPRHCQP
jgi:hypothetical protein